MILSFSSFGEDKSILGYFDDKSYWLNIPDGFYQDANNAARIGAIFLLIPDGYDFNSAPAIIYSAVYADKIAKDAISFDVDKFKSRAPQLTVKDTQKEISTTGKEVLFKEFIDPSSKQQPYEVVSYVQEGDSVVTVVMSAFQENGYKYLLPAFINMAKSYESSTIKVLNKSMQSTAKAATDWGVTSI